MSGIIIAAAGTTPNIGTTIAALAAAWRLAEQTGQQVCYACLNLKSSKVHRYLDGQVSGITLDRLRPELAAGTLTPEKLRFAAVRQKEQPALHVLAGNQLRDQAEFYTAEEIEWYLSCLRLAYPISVVDVSAYWDNAATIVAMREADSRIVVTTPALSHFQEDGRHWFVQAGTVFGIAEDSFQLVVAHHEGRRGGFAMKDIQKELRLAPIDELQLSEPLYIHMDSGNVGEWLAGDTGGRVVMERTAQYLTRKHGIRPVIQMQRQPWYRKLMAHRGGVG